MNSPEEQRFLAKMDAEVLAAFLRCGPQGQWLWRSQLTFPGGPPYTRNQITKSLHRGQRRGKVECNGRRWRLCSSKGSGQSPPNLQGQPGLEKNILPEDLEWMRYWRLPQAERVRRAPPKGASYG